MGNDIIRGKKTAREMHIGQRVKLYRHCKELPITLFAERVGVGVVDAQDIETGMYANLDVAVLLKVSEVFGISYSDLFETDDGRYYANVDDSATLDYLFRKAKEMKVSIAYIGRTLNIPKSTYHNWLEKRRISSPFDMQNVLFLLKVDADELKAALRGNRVEEVKTVVTEATGELTWAEKPAESNLTMMNEVIKACELYKNVGTLIAELDEIIEKAQKLKEALGGK